jgi:superfamily II DNA or RNA helicase
MTPSQINYYNDLPETEKLILKIAALKAFAFGEYHIVTLNTSKRVTHKYVKSILDRAVKFSLFRKVKSYLDEYSVTLDFMLYIYPQLSGFESVWKQVINNYEGPYTIAQFRNCLYTLCHAPSEYPGYELSFSKNLTSEKIGYYAILIQKKEYEGVLHQISPQLLNVALTSIINLKIHTLSPLSEMKSFCDIIRRSHEAGAMDTSSINRLIDMQSGCFKKLSEKHTGTDHVKASYAEAVNYATQGNMNEAFAAFGKALKIQRKTYRDLFLPVSLDLAFYYIATLLSIDPETATPIFRKIEQWQTKNNDYRSSFSAFSAVIYHALNMKEKESEELDILNSHVLNTANESEYIKLFSVLTYYMTERTIAPAMVNAIFSIVKKAWASGYLTLAYEAAYAMKSWFNDDIRMDELFGKIALKLSYPPVLSRITHQEEWEKSLNLLLGLKVSANKTSRDDESKTRIAYFFNPRRNTIQPVLQTYQAKGWSQGRNLSLKKFYECKYQGMTAPDLHIAKTLNCIRDYCREEYEFTKEVYPYLIGHPYVFLENTADIPVEFVAIQPTVKVSALEKGYYTLSTDIKAPIEKISVYKETNTRYLVCNLTPQQIQILRIIIEQSIKVPERGKEKLLELLSVFSAQGMNIHSDLSALGSSQVQVEEIPADSRIRVQLLPWRNGLKAEFFTKPFGVHPPYCKPGKGGKVLMANKENMRLQVNRDMKTEQENENTLLNEIQSLENIELTDNVFTFDNPLDSLFMLDVLAKHQDISVVEWPEGERFRIRCGRIGFDSLHIRLTSGINWFDLEGELQVDEQTSVPLRQLLSLTEKSHNHFIELNPGDFFVLSNDLKKQLDELRLFSAIEKGEVRINKFASIALRDFFEQVDVLRTSELWNQTREQVDNMKMKHVAVPAHLEAELRGYQEEGFQWLARLSGWEAGACLADDMGLGKTVQTLAILLYRAQQGPSLVVCPASVIGNWISEAKRFAPTLQVKTFNNSVNRKELIESLGSGDLLVISYGLLQSESELLSESAFAIAVLDEAHTIKNYATKTSKASMQLKASFRIALTGTPIQNHLGDIWNIFNFLNPGLLGSLQHFADTFVKTDSERTRKYLRKLISPFILRRTKTSVLDELPPKIEIIKKIQLSNEEKTFYDALRRQAIEKSDRSNLNNASRHMEILSEIMKLRKASCNPQLIDPDTSISSSKLSEFLEIVNELKENKHRALVFSQFVAHLAIVRESLDQQGIRYQYLDGSTPVTEREQKVRMFQNGEGDLFLISLKAGGLGLNLTSADFVIHLDPWWNPAIEDQASSRIYRIGQTRPVTIYRLVAENTIEEKIIQLHNTKRDLAESLLEGSDRSAHLSLDELIALIKGGDIER